MSHTERVHVCRRVVHHTPLCCTLFLPVCSLEPCRPVSLISPKDNEATSPMPRRRPRHPLRSKVTQPMPPIASPTPCIGATAQPTPATAAHLPPSLKSCPAPSFPLAPFAISPIPLFHLPPRPETSSGKRHDCGRRHLCLAISTQSVISSPNRSRQNMFLSLLFIYPQLI